MVLLCENCNYIGSEEHMGSMTLEQCINGCLRDEKCFGMEYGKGGRAGHCYFNSDITTTKPLDWSSWADNYFKRCNYQNQCAGASAGTPCDDGNYITLNDQCDGAGKCIGTDYELLDCDTCQAAVGYTFCEYDSFYDDETYQYCAPNVYDGRTRYCGYYGDERIITSCSD